MIQIFYTGAGNSKREQPDPVFSLGNFISTSYVPEDFPGSLFSDLTPTSVDEIIVLGLVADTAKPNTRFTVIDLFKSELRFRAGAAPMQLDCGLHRTQKLPNRFSVPRGIPLTDVLSTNAHLVLALNAEVSIGTELELIDNATTVFNINTTQLNPIDEIISTINSTADYYATRKFNYTTNKDEIFVFKKNLINFESATATSLFDVTSVDATINELGLGDIQPEVPLALFLRRIVEPNSNPKNEQDCERLFTNFKEGIKTDQEFDFKLRFEFDEPVPDPEP